jgi:Lrp/AsnC family transcriptional regulator for asnA, asnC and gidA
VIPGHEIADTHLVSHRSSCEFGSLNLAPLAAVAQGIRIKQAAVQRIHLRFAAEAGRVGTVTADHPMLDELNRAIISQLQQDGRRSYAAIAKAVGLSEAAVRQRVQRLLDGGVMQIVAVTDPLQLGFARQAMVGVRADGDLSEVADKLASLPEVDYVVVTAGSFDLLVEVVCNDDDHLLSLLNNSIRMVPGVRDSETFVYLKLAKQTYSWGAR